MSMRIDDLARESGLTVDTIRYYQREALLPPGEREGRHRVYGEEHLRRLTRIKELQARRFSIAAIRAFVSGDGGLEGVFADEGEDFRYSYDELLERSGVSADLAESLKEAGVLRDPHEFGRVAYDGDDLEMMRAMGELASDRRPDQGAPRGWAHLHRRRRSHPAAHRRRLSRRCRDRLGRG